jgi:hypothetical protein
MRRTHDRSREPVPADAGAEVQHRILVILAGHREGKLSRKTFPDSDPLRWLVIDTNAQPEEGH